MADGIMTSLVTPGPVQSGTNILLLQETERFHISASYHW